MGPYSTYDYSGAGPLEPPEHYQSEVTGCERRSQAPKAGVFNAYVADLEDEGNWNLVDLTIVPSLDHRASISVDYDQLREVCSTAKLSLPTSVVDFIRLTFNSVPASSDRPVVNTLIGVLEAPLETSNHHISALEQQVAWKEA